MKNEKRLMDLGYVNGWKRRPRLVGVCNSKGHRKEYKNIGRCVEEVRCKTCGYKFRIDSGD
jgi:hypothetical protein